MIRRIEEVLVADTTPEHTLLAYAELCKTYNAIRDFRARLLGLLPLASAAGILYLLDNEPSSSVYLVAVGFLGAIVTTGLALYEYHNMTRCHQLIARGRAWEEQLGLDGGQFLDRPAGVAGAIGVQLASVLVYGAVLVGWLFVALVGLTELL